MGIGDLVDEAGAVILAVMGDDAVFTPASGPQVDLRVNYDEEILLQPGALTADVYAPTKTIEFLLSFLGRQPAEGETFTIGANTYTVVEVLANNNHWVKCAVR